MNFDSKIKLTKRTIINIAIIKWFTIIILVIGFIFGIGFIYKELDKTGVKQITNNIWEGKNNSSKDK